MTTPIARERVKRYLQREEHRIDLADLIREIAERAGENVQNEERFPLSGRQLDDDFSVEDRCREYENLLQTIAAVVMTCAYWGGDTVNSGKDPTLDTLSTLSPSQSPTSRFNRKLNDLRRYPATLVLHGAGVAGMAGDNWDLVSTLLTNPVEISNVRSSQPREVLPTNALHPQRLTGEWGRGLDRESAEQSLRSSMKQTLEDPGMEFFVSESKYERAFENFEVLFDVLWYAESGGDHVVSLGTTYWDEALNRTEEAVEEQQENWAPIQTGLSDLTSDEVVTILDELRDLNY